MKPKGHAACANSDVTVRIRTDDAFNVAKGGVEAQLTNYSGRAFQVASGLCYLCCLQPP